MSGDQIFDAYHGKRGQVEMDESRERIHWVCRMAEGQRILDIGCSQGVAPVLLGRDGFDVVGIDSDVEVIEFARAELRKEIETVQRRVQFLLHSAGDFESELPFDSVILGEVIEHLAKPDKVLMAAWRHLTENGRVIITTPFGLCEHPDHKCTFYLGNFLQVVGPYFQGLSLEIRGKYINYLGLRRPQVHKDIPASTLRSELGEEALVRQEAEALERREREQLKSLLEIQEKRAGHYQALQNSKETLQKVQNELGEVKNSLRELEHEKEGLSREKVRLEEQAQMQAQTLRESLRAKTDRARALEEQLLVSESRLGKKVQELQTSLSVRDRLEAAKDQLQSDLKRAKRQSHLVSIRLKTATKNYQDVLETNRYKFGQLLWEAARSPKAAAFLPLSIAKIVARSAVKRIRSPSDLGIPQTDAPTKPVAWPASSSPRVEQSKPRVVVTGRQQFPNQVKDLWIASIMDEMSHACFAPECNLITFTPSNWREVLEARPPHFLFVESAWKGNEGSWQYKIGQYNHPDAGGLEELLDWCREQDIPTVFWNKEDPVHFDKFKNNAAKFDHVFTTDQNMVERYLALPNSRIKTARALPFAAQPKLHNPIFSGRRLDAPCFAGSYYGNRHHARRKQQEALLDAAREFGLVIYDRNFGSGSADFEFPDRFSAHIKGRLPYEELANTYRGHKIFLNVNSVIDSPTMMSRRVYELLASGTIVVSTPSAALKAIFPDLVPTVEESSNAAKILRDILNDETRRRELVRRGLREVLTHHTYRSRLLAVCESMGIKMEGPDHDVAVVALLDSREDFESITEALSRQNRTFDEVLLGIDSNKFELSPEEAKEELGCKTRCVNQTIDDEFLRFRELARFATKPWLFVVDLYKPLSVTYATDLAVCTSFVDAEVIGTVLASEAGSLREHSFVDATDPRSCLVRQELMARSGWTQDVERALPWMHRQSREGVRFYCAIQDVPNNTQSHEKIG